MPDIDRTKLFKEIDAIFEETVRGMDDGPRLRRSLPRLWEQVEGALTHPPRRPMSLRIDEDVIAFFKAQGAGYQVRMNLVLRAYMLAAKAGKL